MTAPRGAWRCPPRRPHRERSPPRLPAPHRRGLRPYLNLGSAEAPGCEPTRPLEAERRVGG